MNTVITGLLLTAVVLQCVILVIVARRFQRKVEEVESFFQPEADGQPSAAGKLYASLVQQACLAFARQMKTTLMGQASGQARGEQAVMEAVVQEGAEQAVPGVGGLIASMPGLSKRLAKNPALANAAMALLSRLGGNGGRNSGGGGGNGGGGFAANAGKYG